MALSCQRARFRRVLRLFQLLAVVVLVLLASPSAWRADVPLPDRKSVTHALKVRNAERAEGYDLYFVNDTAIELVVAKIGSEPFPCRGYKHSFRTTIVAVPWSDLDRFVPRPPGSASIDGHEREAARRYFLESDKVLRSGLELKCVQDVPRDGPERIVDSFIFDGIEGRTVRIRPLQRVVIRSGVSTPLPPVNGVPAPH
jgi:hypothetical protein